MVLGRLSYSNKGTDMPVITVEIQTQYPHLFHEGAALYSQPGLIIGTCVSSAQQIAD